MHPDPCAVCDVFCSSRRHWTAQQEITGPVILWVFLKTPTEIWALFGFCLGQAATPTPCHGRPSWTAMVAKLAPTETHMTTLQRMIRLGQPSAYLSQFLPSSIFICIGKMARKRRGQTGNIKWFERLPVGTHFICCKLIIARRIGPASEIEVHYIPCCAQIVLGDEIGLHLDKKFGRGGWWYKEGSYVTV